MSVQYVPINAVAGSPNKSTNVLLSGAQRVMPQVYEEANWYSPLIVVAI